MSTVGDVEDVEERFYESLDRVLSSACSSSCTSSSAEEDDNGYSNSSSDFHNFALDCLVPIPRFPMGVSNNYDLWISEPSSIEERRLRLLHRLGLSRDPVLSRRVVSFSSESGDSFHGYIGRSVSEDQLGNSRQNGDVCCSYSNPVIIRSKSDSLTDHLSIHSQFVPKSSCHTPRLPISISPSSDASDGHFLLNNRSVFHEARNCNASSLNKPPTGKNGMNVEEIGSDYISSNGELHVLDRDAVDESVCRIKDLDNGTEFVVNEFREDGMWNKLNEVSTGRQLTMEEFEMSVGHSPIVQELMRRQSIDINHHGENGGSETSLRSRKKGGGHWLKSLSHVATTAIKGGYKERRSSDESEKGGRRSSSATEDSQDRSFHGPERIRVRQYGKSCKELNGLYKNQEINAHNGSIWTIKFSLDGKYLASAGEDCVIHVWQVIKTERRGDLLLDKFEDGNLNFLLVPDGSPESTTTLMMSPRTRTEGNKEKKRRGRKLSMSQKSINLDHILVPERIFGLSDSPICSFTGHLDDVLDLSWSKSQKLLSSSMDKTVRLWDLYSKSCLKIFSHSDYVTCIQFNPVDERYFISGSLDAKVRIWSVPDHQVVDWSDLHEMVTAACYTPDGKRAYVGSYKGSCRLYNTSENKLQQESQINLQNKKKKSHQKKITGFQFVPGRSSSEVLVTSSDSRIRVIDGVNLVRKFKGFRNSNSQISGSFTENGKYVVSASEDSHVYVWKHEDDFRQNKGREVSVERACEHFYCRDVSVAIPLPGHYKDTLVPNHPPISSASNGYFFDRPGEKLLGCQNNPTCWGMVIVTASLMGEITTYQNFGLPIGGTQ